MSRDDEEMIQLKLPERPVMPKSPSITIGTRGLSEADKKLLASWDKDGDGTLSISEIKHAIHDTQVTTLYMKLVLGMSFMVFLLLTGSFLLTSMAA